MSGPSAATADRPPVRPRSASPFAALSFRPFLWWFLSQILSASGGMTQAVATSWLVLQLTGSAVDLSALSAITMLPSLLFGAWCGALVDRLDRRRVLIATQSLLTAVSLLLYTLIAVHHASYWSILALSGATGLVSALDGPARQVYVLDLVGRRRLASAVSLYEVILNTSRVLGPAIGGMLLALLGPAACVLANALSYLAPLAVLLRQKPDVAGHEELAGHEEAAGHEEVTGHEEIAGHEQSASDDAAPVAKGPARTSRRGATREGLRYAWSVPAIRSCLLIAAASGILFNSSLMFPLMAVRVFHLGGGGYGALLSAFGLGALPGALLAARGGEPTGRQVALLAGATGACTVATGFSPALPLLYVGAAAVGFSSIWMVARANTLVQLCARPELRGRVMGAWTMALPGASPITSIAVGVLADAAGARAAFCGAGLLMLSIVAGSWHALAGGGGPAAPGIRTVRRSAPRRPGSAGGGVPRPRGRRSR